MFRIEMLPAYHGDCLWIEYGSVRKVRRILIDGGYGPTYSVLKARILALPPEERTFELLVISHVDADHIEGAVKLLADKSLQIEFKDIWFNGFRHLPDEVGVDFGGVQGEYLSALIQDRNAPWNEAFGGNAIVVPKDGPLPELELADGLKLTLLSPTQKELRVLSLAWTKEVRAAGLDPDHPAGALEHLEKKGRRLLSFDVGNENPVETWYRAPYVKDTSPANGSSIAFLTEYQNKAVLFGADAYSEVLDQSLLRLNHQRDQELVDLDAFKLPHHGSRANLSRELLTRLRARFFLISSNGDRFGHPDPECLARILLSDGLSPTFVFNYLSEETEIWADPSWMDRHSYSAIYPEGNTAGIALEL